MNEQRRAAVKAILRSVTIDPTHPSGQCVVVAFEDDLMGDVLARIIAHTPPVTLAIYHPGDQEITMVTVTPGTQSTGA